MNRSGIIRTVFLLTFSAVASAIAVENQMFEAESAELIGGAFKAADASASGGYLVGLSNPGQGVKFAGLPPAGKLAIRYATDQVGTISVAVNGQSARKVNIHSSGALTGSFLNAIIDIAIPPNAQLAIGLATNDVPLNIDRIVVGDGDLGLPPDIWNLPPLPVAPGPYTADWKAISRLYTVPVPGELALKRRWAVQTTRGNGYANGNFPGRLHEGSGRPLSLRACGPITLGVREPRCSSS